jgi:hypothetical protein
MIDTTARPAGPLWMRRARTARRPTGRPRLSHYGTVTRPLTRSERQRLRTPGYLWRALIPLLVVVGSLVLFTRPTGTRPDGVHVINTAGTVAAARRQAGFALLLPVGLGPRWRATSAQLVPAGPAGQAGPANTAGAAAAARAAGPTGAAGSSPTASFRIGYVTPRGQYAEFLEGDDAPQAVLATYGPLTGVGNLTVNGHPWAQYQTSSDRQLITRTVGAVTVVVTGSADQQELAELAASLR